MRRIRIFALLKVFISPIVRLYNLFLTFKAEQIINQSGTPQTCMLKKMVNDKLGIVIDIVEDTGLPNDFIVKVSSQELDKERQLIALINKYKQAGKSFTLNNAAVTFAQTWGDFVCELETLTQAWGGFICESEGAINNIITANAVNGTNQGTVTVHSSLAPVSVILIVSLHNPLTDEDRSVLITYESNTTNDVDYYIDYNGTGDAIVDIELTVHSGDGYNYTLVKTIS